MADTSANKPTKPAKSAAKPKPIADVTHPDEVPTDAASKPVLVSNRPIIKDPMVNQPEADKTDSPAPAENKPPARTHNFIQPLNDAINDKSLAEVAKTESEPVAEAAEEADKSDPPAKAPEAAAPTEEPALADTKTDAKPDPKADPVPETSTDETETESTEAETSDAEAPVPGTNQKAAQAKQSEAAAAELAKHESAVDKLINSKQYFLPINSVEKRRAKRVVILGIFFSLLLAAAWVNIALDAGLIEIPGIKPVTHFFST